MSKKEMIMPPLVLTIICLAVTAALVFAYQFTAPYIAQAKEAAANAARSEVFPGDFTFQEYTGEITTENVTDIYEAYQGQNLAGYIFTISIKGYSTTPLVVMIGLDQGGNIAGVKVVECSETPGLGSVVAEDPYVSQFTGKTVDTYTEVDTISGATISSSALRGAVASATEAFQTLAGGASDE